MGSKETTDGYAADIRPVRSILDQVDDYLNDKHEPERDNTPWQSMQVDLDRLSHTLFEHGQDHQQDQHQHHQHQQQVQAHVRPDMVFSPMASPVVVPNQVGSVSANATPFLGTSTGSTSTANTPFMAANSGNGGFKNKKNSRYTPGQFSPLSSPALVALDQQQMLNFALPESTLSRRTPSSTSLRAKRATGSGTASKVVKNSPNLSSRRRYSAEYFKNGSNGSREDLIFKLPEHAVSQRQSGVQGEEDISGDAISPSPESKMTPATLMNYPKVILPSNNRSEQSQSPREKSENDATVWRATESPVIKPRHSVNYAKPSVRATQLPTVPSSQSSSASSMEQRQDLSRIESRPKNKSSRSSSNISLIENGISAGSPVEEDECSKREVHKVAEQGRRNRLNLALTQLSSLLPSELKETVTIPSKATTVELACEYIKLLRGEKSTK